MKTLFLSAFLFAVVMAAPALADHGESAELDAQLHTELVTSADLGIEDPGLLPSSPFYFFKDLRRTVQTLFTFDSVKRAELEVEFANEKAAEALKAAEGEQGAALNRALAKFQKSQEILTGRLEGLRETSENPNIDRLLDMVAERAVQHEKLFEQLEGRFEAELEVEGGLETARMRIRSSLAKAAEKDTPEKLKARFETLLKESRGSEFKDARSAEILAHFAEEMPPDAKARMEELRLEFAENFRERVEDAAERGATPEEVQALLSAIPGDDAERAVLLEELRLRASDRAASHFEASAEHFGKALEQSARVQAKVAEQIEEAAEELAELREEMAERPTVSQAVVSLAQEAEARLGAAREAFEAQQYGQAFGLATAAEALAKNGKRLLEFQEEAQERQAEFEERARALELRLQDRVREERAEFEERVEELQRKAEERRREFEEEAQGRAEELRERAQEEREDILDRATEQLRDRLRGERSEDRESVVCTREFAPVCGVDGKTYSNRCVAERQNNVRVEHEGECRVPEESDGRTQLRDAQEFLERR